MSWDVELVDWDTRKPLEVTAHEEGGTYMVGGNPRAELNVTYNYGRLFRLAAKSVGWEILTNLSKMPGTKPFDILLQAHAWSDDAIRALEGKQAVGTTDFLARLIEQLRSPNVTGPDERVNDYWVDAPRNVAHCLSILLGWAQEHPTGVWQVT